MRLKMRYFYDEIVKFRQILTGLNLGGCKKIWGNAPCPPVEPPLKTTCRVLLCPMIFNDGAPHEEKSMHAKGTPSNSAK